MRISCIFLRTVHLLASFHAADDAERYEFYRADACHCGGGQSARVFISCDGASDVAADSSVGQRAVAGAGNEESVLDRRMEEYVAFCSGILQYLLHDRIDLRCSFYQ